MNQEQRIKQIADEAIEKIKAIAAGKDNWPENGDEYLYMNASGGIDNGLWWGKGHDRIRKARRRIAPNTDEGRARLERLAEWEVFFLDFMTAGDAEPGRLAYSVEFCSPGESLLFTTVRFGSVGQRGFTTEAKRDEWINKWGKDYVEKMLKGGMP